VRQERQRVLDVLDLVPDSAVGDARLPLPSRPAPDVVRAAFDALQRPDQRVIDELFWLWGEPGECGCAPDVHELHDAAVLVHAEVLDLEAGEPGDDPEARSEMWVDVADAWMDALDVCGFWAHVRHRVFALADRRLDESTVDGLRGMMARALMNPQVVLARRPGNAVLAGLLDAWDADSGLIDNARADAAAPTYDAVEAQLVAIGHLHHGGTPLPAARQALEELPDLARRMEILVPHERFRRSATLRNRVSIALNNCALPIPDDADKPTLALKHALYEHAIEFAVAEDDRRTITENLADLRFSQRFAQAGGSLATSPWDQVNALVRARRVDEAIKLLHRMRDSEDRPDRRVEIDAALAQLAQTRAVVGGGPPAPWRWMTTLGMVLLGAVAVVLLVDMTWHLDMWWVVAGSALTTTLLTFLACTTGYRVSAATASPVMGLFVLAMSGYAIFRVQSYGLLPVWMALIGIVAPLEVTLPAGMWLAQKWNSR
jgi:pentatricopeptide repeat protein